MHLEENPIGRGRAWDGMPGAVPGFAGSMQLPRDG